MLDIAARVLRRPEPSSLRHVIVGICSGLVSEGFQGESEKKKKEQEYWARASLVEALFDLGGSAESASEFEVAKNMAPEVWMVRTTEEQLGKLGALLPVAPARQNE